MESGCEHLEASPIGQCVICERTVCSECYREVFHAMICDQHEALEEEANWELVGFFVDTSRMEERRFVLEDAGITSLVAEEDEEAIELYVPTEEKDDAYVVLVASQGESQFCKDCRIELSKDIEECPMCGVQPSEPEEEADHSM